MKLNEEKIKEETRFSEMYYQELKRNLKDYEEDNHQKQRMRSLECKSCFYLKNGFAGQAFTEFECRNCGDKEYYPNTAVPRYCRKCAEKHQSCVRCAAKL